MNNITKLIIVAVAVGGKALSSLRKLSSPTAKVIRDGSLRAVGAQELVPGDIVELEAGDRVPADVRLIRVFGLKTASIAEIFKAAEPAALLRVHYFVLHPGPENPELDLSYCREIG